ncbi:MAG: hypothetical protein ABWJ42_02865 [Sulfolobales archaeon]
MSDSSAESSAKAVVDRARLYPQIFAIKNPKEYRSDCSYYELRNVEIKRDFIITAAYCKALRRYLSVHEAELCVRSWDKCPYRIIENSIKRSYSP